MNRIHQAATRAKRKETDNPKIVLWGNTFIQQEPVSYMSNDLKGDIAYTPEQLIRLLYEKWKNF